MFKTQYHADRIQGTDLKCPEKVHVAFRNGVQNSLIFPEPMSNLKMFMSITFLIYLAQNKGGTERHFIILSRKKMNLAIFHLKSLCYTQSDR